MTEYDNSGTLGKNHRREKDSHPEYTGKLTVEGTEYWLNAWLKTAGPNSQHPGEKFYSLSVKRKEQQAAQPAATPQAGLDDIPF